MCLADLEIINEILSSVYILSHIYFVVIFVKVCDFKELEKRMRSDLISLPGLLAEMALSTTLIMKFYFLRTKF